MKLRLVSNLSQRPITNLEILFKFVFGDNIPNIFESDKLYEKGDIVVSIDTTGNPRVLQCLVKGRYNSDDLLNPLKWRELTIVDAVTGGTIEEVQKIIGNLGDYLGGKHSTVIEITNALYNKVEKLISNFPEHDSEVDGGYFENYVPGPEDPNPPTQGAIKEHDNSPYAHSNIIIDGNTGGSIMFEELIQEDDSKTNEGLLEHNINPNAHSNIIIDGNV